MSKITKTDPQKSQNEPLMQTHSSLRVSSATKELSEKLRQQVNGLSYGKRKLSLDEIVMFSLKLVTEKHIKMLQQERLTHTDRMELLRQRYIEKNGPITKEEFVGFVMTSEFQKFKKDNIDCVQIA